jgi:heavy metal response regulator
MRILLIEDETKIANFIERGLKEQKFAVDVAHDGEEGLYLADINTYDLIILDLMLPKIDGLEICKEIRHKKISIPILILTARSHVDDRVRGLDVGADDYLAKPFAFAELLARIRALLRRGTAQHHKILKIADLELNLLSLEVKRANKIIPLTAKEYALLEYFMRNTNQVLTRTMISEHVWNEDFHSMTNVIDVHVRYLRKKIDEGHEPKLIHTIRGIGYVLKEEP